MIPISDFENGFDKPRVFRIKEVKHVEASFQFPVRLASDLGLPKRIALGMSPDTPAISAADENQELVPENSESQTLASLLKNPKGGRPRTIGIGGTPPGVLYQVYKGSTLAEKMAY